MANYRQLLFSTGGGVISNTQKDPQNDCATIAIGLGGTGVKCLANLKKQIFQRLQSDDEKNFVPSYQHIKFLAVDTDPNELGVETDFTALDRTTEFFDIHSDDINALLRNVRIMRGTPYFNWLRDDLNVLFAGAGAGGVRQCGRLLLMNSSDVFKSKVQQIINAAKAGLPAGSPVNIHIFTGMGGGTGSGTFLDACYIVRKAIQELGIHNALIFGYFVLPDVNLSVPAVAANTVVSNYIKSNGFAAMKELDYCMNFEKNGGAWDQEYKGFHIGPTKDKPVDVCHLVSSNTLGGVALENGFAYAMNVISDFVMQFVVKNDITMTSHIANYGMAMGGVKKQHGANYGYCVLGAANATVPFREISTYLVSKLFKEMSIMKQKAPTDADVAAFADLHGLTYRKLYQAVNRGVLQIPMLDLGNDAWKDYRDMPETDKMDPTQLRLPPDIESNYNRFLANNLNIYSSNEQALMAAWSKRSDVPGAATSKVCETMNALIDVILDPEKGPYYATILLGGAERTNLLTLLYGALKETEVAQQNMQSESLNRIQAVKARRSAFVNAGAFANKKRLFEEMLSAITAYYEVMTRIESLNHMKTVINNVIEQLTALKQTYFDVYVRIMNDLIDTFDENYTTLAALNDAVEDPFIVPLMKIADLRDSLDKTVANMKLPSEMTAFHQTFFKNYDIWLNREERKICPFVSQYLISRFANYTSKTLNDYLEMRFKTNEPATLSNFAYREILRPLAEKADPLFWLAGGNFSASSAGALGYCSVPDSSAVLLSSVQSLTSASPELKEIRSKQSDRIFLLRCTVGIPIYAYNGISVYYNNYLASRDKGMHYYEGCGPTSGNASDERNWRMLYDMMPYSANNRTTSDIEEKAKLYEKAVADGIIKTIGMDYYVSVTPDIKDKATEIENAIKNANDVDTLKTVQDAFEAFAANLPEQKRITIENDGTTGFEAAVRKDHALASDVIMNAIADEMKKAEQIAAIRAKLAKAIEDTMSKLTVRDDFFNALFTGVFKFQLPKVLYQFEEYGIPDEMTLSDPTMPKGRMPLYQAFLSFQAMEDYQRESVKNAADDRLAVIDPALKEACTGLKQIVTPQYLNVMKGQATRFPDEKNSILEFFGAFNQALEDFVITYGL